MLIIHQQGRILTVTRMAVLAIGNIFEGQFDSRLKILRVAPFSLVVTHTGVKEIDRTKDL